METEKAKFIVNSKVFRKFLKDLMQNYKGLRKPSEVMFMLDRNDLTCQWGRLSVEHKGSGQFMVNISSIEKMIKVLKQCSEQPIKVGFEDTWNCFNIFFCI